MGLSRTVIDRAARQGGLITRSQLLSMGHSPGGIDWFVRAAAITPVGSGIYRVVPPADHADLIKGALLALPDAVASHHSAAHLLQLPRLPELIPTVSVASSTTHVFPEVVVRRCDDLSPRHIVNVDGVRVTGVARSLFDLAGVLTFTEFDLIAEAVLVTGRISISQLETITSELARRGKRGSQAVRDFLQMRLGTDFRATPLETKGRRVLVGGGLPLPIPQHPMPWDPRRRFDDAYPEVALAVEWDSRAWHEQRSAMRSDRSRDREAAMHDWYIARFTWEDVTENPKVVVETVRQLLTTRTKTT